MHSLRCVPRVSVRAAGGPIVVDVVCDWRDDENEVASLARTWEHCGLHGVESSHQRERGNGESVVHTEAGVTYTFSVSSSGHPFYISKVEPSDWGRSSSDGNVIKGPIDSGTITFTPDSDTPNYIFITARAVASWVA